MSQISLHVEDIPIDSSFPRPERWLDPLKPPANRVIPGVYSNTMSFLSGVHACIGYRVALAQYVHLRADHHTLMLTTRIWWLFQDEGVPICLG